MGEWCAMSEARSGRVQAARFSDAQGWADDAELWAWAWAAGVELLGGVAAATVAAEESRRSGDRAGLGVITRGALPGKKKKKIQETGSAPGLLKYTLPHKTPSEALRSVCGAGHNH